ncbi:MAG TPA: TIGR04222 domain-containing membrane protein [Pyrinomonadaceae bacterium]
MEWLWYNPIADMRGPTFLLFYACASAATIAVCAMLSRQLDWTGSMQPPPLPSTPDPYEIAYLRGGENEVARTAVFALMRSGHLHVIQRGKKSLIERTGPPAPTAALGHFERRAYGWFDHPQESAAVFRQGGLAEKLRRHCADYEQKLRGEKLLTPPEASDRARLVRLLGLAVIAGLGAYKLAIALSRGRTNVIFLILLGAVALVVLFKVCRSPRLSRRGRAHLERLRTAFDRLKGGGQTLTETATMARESADERGPYATPGGLDPALLTLGVFGVAALAGADHDNYTRAFNRSTATADSSGGSASSCGSASSWSDSSSSGGDSGGGDSGGSSCGGGCGGCGGGGE